MNGTLTPASTAPVVASSAASAPRGNVTLPFLTLVKAPPRYTRAPRTTTSFTGLFGTAWNVETTAPVAVSLTMRLMAVFPPTDVKAPLT